MLTNLNRFDSYISETTASSVPATAAAFAATAAAIWIGPATTALASRTRPSAPAPTTTSSVPGPDRASAPGASATPTRRNPDFLPETIARSVPTRPTRARFSETASSVRLSSRALWRKSVASCAILIYNKSTAKMRQKLFGSKTSVLLRMQLVTTFMKYFTERTIVTVFRMNNFVSG